MQSQVQSASARGNLQQRFNRACVVYLIVSVLNALTGLRRYLSLFPLDTGRVIALARPSVGRGIGAGASRPGWTRERECVGTAGNPSRQSNIWLG